MIGFPNRADSAALSGGGWVATLPITNIKDRTLGKVARSTNLLPANTQFDIDQGTAVNTRALAFVNHNFSLDAKYRIRGTNDPGGSYAPGALAYDSGWSDVWPEVYPYGTKEWEEDSFWSGKYTPEEIEGYTRTLVHLLPINLAVRRWHIEIDDQTNPAGYAEFGRLFIGPVWQPVNNMSRNGSVGWETKTQVQDLYSGGEVFDARKPFRVARFSLNWMDEDEGLAIAFELLRRAGIDKEVLWIHDPDDTVHAIRRRFIGRLRELSPIENPYHNVNSTSFQIKEIQ
ncbi:hypothetical protein ACFQUU_08805 [Herbaspirillum sp. GCM10030257]|uniref:hypothetical protein n=1 Tax=Herbaspirillum sp. GCM10030257 TaxID=3273393 RepID=UPI0036137C05